MPIHLHGFCAYGCAINQVNLCVRFNLQQKHHKFQRVKIFPQIIVHLLFISDNIIISKNAMKIYPKILSEIGAQCKYSCNKNENSARNQVWILYAFD